MSNEALNGNFAKPMLAPVRVLNLYAGIGGNRKHWENVEVTAIEYNEEIANIYKQLHPNDFALTKKELAFNPPKPD